jgi:hypothetical protein
MATRAIEAKPVHMRPLPSFHDRSIGSPFHCLFLPVIQLNLHEAQGKHREKRETVLTLQAVPSPPSLLPLPIYIFPLPSWIPKTRQERWELNASRSCHRLDHESNDQRLTRRAQERTAVSSSNIIPPSSSFSSLQPRPFMRCPMPSSTPPLIPLLA